MYVALLSALWACSAGDHAESVVATQPVVPDLSESSCANVADTVLFPQKIRGVAGYIGKNGKVVIEPKFWAARRFSEGLAEVKMDHKYGFIDTTGAYVVEPQYDSVHPFSEGLAAVSNKPKTSQPGSIFKSGYIDQTGKVVIALKYNYAGPFSEGLAKVGIARGPYPDIDFFFIDPTGKKAFDLPHMAAGDFTNGLAKIRSAEKLFGYVDKKGNIVVEPQFSDARDFADGLARVQKESNGKWGYIDTSGAVLLDFQYSEATDFRDGLAAASVLDSATTKEQRVLFDKKGQVVAKTDCDKLHSYGQGLAVCEKGGRLGYVDKKGQVVIAPRFDLAARFENCLGQVGSTAFAANEYDIDNFLWSYIDNSGTMVWDFEIPLPQ